LTRILTLPETYRIQLQSLLEHLINIDKENYKINHRESYIFTNPIQNEDDYSVSKLGKDSSNEEPLINNEYKLVENVSIDSCLRPETSIELRRTANSQQKYLLDFVQSYLDELLKFSRRPSEILQPKAFHIVVNGLAGSGKSYVIAIIEKMLSEYCVAESATVSRPRRNYGLLKMAHTGKAALNIHGSTIHSALEIVKIYTRYCCSRPSLF
jgi:hypothetical protein